MTNKIKNYFHYIWVIELEDNVWFSGGASRTICPYNAKTYYDQEEAQRSLTYAMRYSEINRFKNIKIKQLRVTYERCDG